MIHIKKIIIIYLNVSNQNKGVRIFFCSIVRLQLNNWERDYSSRLYMYEGNPLRHASSTKHCVGNT